MTATSLQATKADLAILKCRFLLLFQERFPGAIRKRLQAAFGLTTPRNHCNRDQITLIQSGAGQHHGSIQQAFIGCNVIKHRESHIIVYRPGKFPSRSPSIANHPSCCDFSTNLIPRMTRSRSKQFQTIAPNR